MKTSPITPEALLSFAKSSITKLHTIGGAQGFRTLIESGSIENLVSSLLFMELIEAGHSASREFPLGNRFAADIAIHEAENVMVEIKQLHLKDGCTYAPPNLSADLERHKTVRSLGLLFFADERSSSLPLHDMRFGGANRSAKTAPAAILERLPHYFAHVIPETLNDSVLLTFPDDGGLALYGFVVAAPRVTSGLRGTIRS